MVSKDEILRQWLDKGKEELRVAEYISTMQYPTPIETICYLCQQSAEKYLKSFIFYNDIEPEKTHDLKLLLEVCMKFNAEFSVLLTKATILTDYAVLPRYPNELQITYEDMKNALNYAKAIEAFVFKIVNQLKLENETSENEYCEN